jgi:hypothetical protein
MNVVTATFDYETVKNVLKQHYLGIDFDKWDQMPDEEKVPFYLRLFSNLLLPYGVDDNSVTLRKNEYPCRLQKQRKGRYMI